MLFYLGDQEGLSGQRPTRSEGGARQVYGEGPLQARAEQSQSPRGGSGPEQFQGGPGPAQREQISRGKIKRWGQRRRCIFGGVGEVQGAEEGDPAAPRRPCSGLWVLFCVRWEAPGGLWAEGLWDMFLKTLWRKLYVLSFQPLYKS